MFHIKVQKKDSKYKTVIVTKKCEDKSERLIRILFDVKS